MRRARIRLFTCTHCGADVAPKATFCRECGSDASTGWSDDAEASGQALPGEEEFDYDEFLDREFGGGSVKTSARRRSRLFWMIILVPLVWALLHLF